MALGAALGPLHTTSALRAHRSCCARAQLGRAGGGPEPGLAREGLPPPWTHERSRDSKRAHGLAVCGWFRELFGDLSEGVFVVVSRQQLNNNTVSRLPAAPVRDRFVADHVRNASVRRAPISRNVTRGLSKP